MQQPSPEKNAGADPTLAAPTEAPPAAKTSSARERWDDFWGLRDRNLPLARLRYDFQACANSVDLTTQLFPDFSEMHRLSQIAKTIVATIYTVPFSETLRLADEAVTLLDDALVERVLTTPLSEEMEDGEKREFLEGLVRSVNRLRSLLLEIQPHTF